MNRTTGTLERPCSLFMYFQFSRRVKAENLEEIARVGKEPLPPYPIEENRV